MNQDDLVSLQNEIDILSQVDHPNVVKLYEIIEEEDGEEVFLVMELMTGGEASTRSVNWLSCSIALLRRSTTARKKRQKR